MAIEQERTEAAISELHCQTPTRLALEKGGSPIQAVKSPLNKGAATAGDLPISLNSEMCISGSLANREGG